MTHCPTPEQLGRVIEGTLTPDEKVPVEDHVDQCPACQEALEQLTAGPFPAASPAPVDQAAETFIARVQALGTMTGMPPPRPDSGPVPLPDVPGYEVQAEIGRGGMGVVYRARHRRLNRLVALKMLTEYGMTDPTLRVRFLVEAEAVARLQHPNVVQVYEFGEYAGRPYLAMEYAGAGSLADRLAAGPPFPPARAADLAARLADAVAAAHQKGIIHRDLKPSNILLTETGHGAPAAAGPVSALGPTLIAPAAEVQPKVTDFGIARVVGSDLTATGEVLGTPNYMAPEQAAGRVQDIGIPTDVYGLGAILYELLTGRPPFLGKTAVATLQQVVHEEPPPPRSVAPTVPRDLDTICRKCLEKDPKKRYPTAAALADDLRAHLAGRTISARPAGAWERVGRFARRNPVLVGAGAVLAAAFLGAFLWVNHARGVAEENARIAGEAQLAAEAHAQAASAARAAAEENARAADAARREESRARRSAERAAAWTAFDQAFLRCEAGDVATGLDGFTEARRLAALAEDGALARVIERNRAGWERHRPTNLVRFDPPDPARPVTAVAFADGGRLVATGGGGDGPKAGVVRVWPVGGTPDGRPAVEIPTPVPYIRRPEVIAIVPARAGGPATAHAAYGSGYVGEWDLRTGRAVRPPFPDLLSKGALPAVQGLLDPRRPSLFTQSLNAAALTGPGAWTGDLLAEGAIEGTIRIWDLTTRTLLKGADGTPFFTHLYPNPRKKPTDEPGPPARAGAVMDVAFVNNGGMLLSAGREHGVIMWGLPVARDPEPRLDRSGTVTPPLHQFDLGGPVFRLAARPDGQYFLAGGETAVSLWYIHDRERPVWVRQHPQRTGALAFSPDGDLCAAGDHAGNVRCWDVKSGLLVTQFRHADGVSAFQFDAKGEHLLVGGRDGSSALWRLPARPELDAVPVSPTPTGAGVVIRIGMTLQQAVPAAGFGTAPGETWAASLTGLAFWPPRSDWGDSRLRSSAAGGSCRVAAVSPDRGWAVVAGWSGASTRAWRLTPGPPRGVDLAKGGDALQVEFLPDSRSFLTLSAGPVPGPAGRPGCVQWWTLGAAPSATLRSVLPLPDAQCLAAHPDGKTVLVGRRDGQWTGFWDLETGRPLDARALPHGGTVTAAAVHPGGRWAATGGQGGTVRIWPLTGGGVGPPVGRSPVHADRVTAVAFATGPADGVLATASDDGTARFWDVATGLPLGPPLRHPEAVLSVAFDQTGGRIITGCRSGYATAWAAPAGR
jgi:WD40 repeat protein